MPWSIKYLPTTPNVVFQHYKPISHSNRAIKTNTSNPLKYSHTKTRQNERWAHKKKKKFGKKESTHRARVKLKELSSVSLPLALPRFSYLGYSRWRYIYRIINFSLSKKLKNQTQNPKSEKINQEKKKKKKTGYRFPCSGRFGHRLTCQRAILLHRTTRTPWRRGGQRSWRERFWRTRRASGESTRSWGLRVDSSPFLEMSLGVSIYPKTRLAPHAPPCPAPPLKSRILGVFLRVWVGF